MAVYEYECGNCGDHHEEIRSMYTEGPQSCPTCQEPLGGAFNQVFSVAAVHVYGNPVTLGQQAEMNARRFGKEQCELMEAAATRTPYTGPLPKGGHVAEPQKVKDPWWRDGSIPGTKLDKPLEVNKIRDVTDYIMTGDL